MALEIEKLKLAPAYQVVSMEIERRILDGSLKPGDQLPTETELASRFGVNRSTVREGIRQLESEGLVRRQGGRRLAVALPHHGDLAPRTSRAMMMHQVTFRELWDVARTLEPLAAGLAAENATEADRAAIAANLAATEAVVAGGGSPAALDTEFHTLVSLAAHNRALLLAREPVGLLLYPAYEAIRPKLPQSAGRLVEAHRRVVGAIEARDAAEASRWMLKHVADFRRGWELAGLSMDAPIPAAP